MAKTKRTCPSCGGAPHHVSLDARHGVCKTCGGKVYYYPPREHDAPAGGWVHTNQADWLDNPHPAEVTA